MTNMKMKMLLPWGMVLASGCALQPPISVAACTDYCSTYEEGYQWALKNGLPQQSFCEGYAADFVRGCEQQIEDKQQSFAPRPGF